VPESLKVFCRFADAGEITSQCFFGKPLDYHKSCYLNVLGQNTRGNMLCQDQATKHFNCGMPCALLDTLKDHSNMISISGIFAKLHTYCVKIMQQKHFDCGALLDIFKGHSNLISTGTSNATNVIEFVLH
jgi:hypothetical protein